MSRIGLGFDRGVGCGVVDGRIKQTSGRSSKVAGVRAALSKLAIVITRKELGRDHPGKRPILLHRALEADNRSQLGINLSRFGKVFPSILT